jgi:LuxR family transcriptional regulator, maltose regulon positive regulatory protein
MNNLSIIENSRSLELLATKIEYPKLSGLVIPRRNCIDKLNQSLKKQITVISAPTGYGKTTLLTAWLQLQPHSSQHQIWISIDEYDNSEIQFWAYIIAAFQKRYPKFRVNLHQFTRTYLEVDHLTGLNQIINEIDKTDELFHLIIDDYHLIMNDGIHHDMEYLINHQPANLHITFISRTTMPFSVSRLRAQNQIVELTAEDLAFSLEETKDFLVDIQGLIISPGQIQSLYSATEGWIAGLQLAAYSIQNNPTVHLPSGRITENNPKILEYLSEEVINKQEGAIREFLLKTSLLSEFNAPLCNAILNIDNSQEIIRHIEKANLFIKAIDQSHEWYRYHPLFCGNLSVLLKKLYPEEINPIHQKACAWFQENKYPDKAIPHALALGNLDLAAKILDNWSMEAIAKLDLSNLIYWSSYISDELFKRYPNFGINFALANQILLRHDLVEPILDKVESALEKLPLDPQSKWKMSVIRVIQQSRGENYEGTNEQLMSLLSYTLPNDTYYFGLINHSIAETDETIGVFEEAVKAYERASAFGITRNLNTEYVFSQCAIARVRMFQGRLTEAKKTFEQAEEFALTHNLAFCVFALAHTGIMEIAIERYSSNFDQSSIQNIADNFDMVGTSPILPHYLFIISYRLYRHFTIKNDESRSQYFLDYIRKNISINNYALDFPEIAYMQDMLESSTHKPAEPVNLLLEQVKARPVMKTTNKILQAKIQLQYNNPQAASAILSELHDDPLLGKVKKLQILHSLVQAVLEKKLQNDELSRSHIEDALSAAEPEGFIRIFNEQGDLVEQLIRDYLLTFPDGLDTPSTPVSRSFVEKVISTYNHPATSTIQIIKMEAPHSNSPAEQLTQREIEVLDLLIAGKSVKEIAVSLMISINTARTYVKRIYRKLGIHSKKDLFIHARGYYAAPFLQLDGSKQK